MNQLSKWEIGDFLDSFRLFWILLVFLQDQLFKKTQEGFFGSGIFNVTWYIIPSFDTVICKKERFVISSNWRLGKSPTSCLSCSDTMTLRC